MRRFILLAAVSCLCGCALTGVGRAGLILQPAAASTDMGTFAGSPANTINQSG